MDSIVANYTGNGRVRDRDAYSPEGNPYFGELKERRERRRPDRATIRYSSLARLSREVEREKLEVRQFQDFTPTPGTISTAMYVTGFDRDTGHPI